MRPPIEALSLGMSSLSGAVYLNDLAVYLPFVEGIPVALSVAVVLAQCRGEVVCAGEILLGAHVEVVMVCVVQYGIQSNRGRYAYRAWG